MPKWTDEQREKVLALSKEKKSIRQIAETVGISKSSIGLFLKGQAPTNDVVEHVEETEETEEAEDTNDEPNTTTIVEPMIDSAKADLFLSKLQANGAKITPVVPTKHSAFIDGLLSVEAEHVAPPFKARFKPEAQPKTPKPRAKAEPKPRAEKVVDEPEKKPDLIAKITFNVNTFEALLADVIRGDKEAFLKSLDKMGSAVLETTLKTIETTRSIKNLTNQFLQFFYMGSSMVEIGSQQFLGMRTQGFTNMLQQTQHDELRMIMQEMAMEQKEKFQKIQRPEVRLAMIMTTTLLAVNSQNSLIALKQQQQQQVRPAQAQPQVVKPPSQKEEDKTVVQPVARPVNIPGQPSITRIMPKDKEAQFKDL